MAQGFFRAGWQELRRKWSRRQLRRQIQQHERTRKDLLQKLGRRARSEGIDFSGLEPLKQQIAQLEGKASQLADTGRTLQTQISVEEEKRRNEVAAFDQRQRAVESQKQPVDASLATARRLLAEREQRVRQEQARLSALAAEAAAIEQQIAALDSGSAPDREAQLLTARARKPQLESEQAMAAAALRDANAGLPPAQAEVARFEAESQVFAQQIAQIEGERKTSLSAIDTGIGGLKTQLQATQRESSSVEQQQGEQFTMLGAALYEQKPEDPRLAEALGAVSAEDARGAALRAQVEASLAQTHAMPSGTMLRFGGTLAAIVLVMVGALWGLQWARGAWGQGETQATEESEATVEINPYLDHDLKQDTAYVLANQYIDARSDEEARKILLEVFRKIGVGVYTHEGQRILAGSERGPNDLWMYDFHWKILAREGRRPSGIRFTDYSHMIGQFLLELPDPQQLEPVLFLALKARYEEAQKAPTDPRNFNVLFMDGLARRHVRPYSFGNSNDASITDSFLDPIQTYLLLLEFFARPPAPAQRSRLLDWGLVPKAYAQSGVCDLIQGDAQGNFGAGIDTVSLFTEHVPGMVGKITQVVGNVTGVVGFAGDLLTLYGIDIKVQPQPYTIHLIHDEPFVAGIQATVTFDGEIVSDQVLKCGWLAGKKMPVKGPLPGVRITWGFSPDLPWPLVMHSGMMSFLTGHAGGLQTTTDASGSSVFLIDPRPCPHKEGKRVGRDYMATVSARVVTADIPTPSGLGLGLVLKFAPGMLEYFMGGRKGYARFRAEWHERKPPEKQY